MLFFWSSIVNHSPWIEEGEWWPRACLFLPCQACVSMKNISLLFLLQNIFWQTGTYLELPKASSPWLAQSTKILKFFPPDAQKIHSMALSVFRFLCQLFSKLLSSSWMIFKELKIFNIFINKFCMAINLCELQSDLSWKDAAGSTEGITRSSVNYLSSYDLEQVCKEIKKKWTFSWAIM